MGSFSVSCGMSGLPISGGNEIALILLVRNSTPRYNHNGSYMHETDLYKPFSSPIYGNYSDYGTIEDIVEDANTKALEDFFNLPIQEIVNLAAEPSGIYSSSLMSKFAGSKDLNKYDRTPEQDLILAGFKKVSDGQFSYGDYNVKVVTTEKSVGEHVYSQYSYFVFNMKSKVDLGELKGVYDTRNFLETFSRETGVFPGLENEDPIKLTMLRMLSAMFVHKKVLSEMTQEIDSQEFLQDIPNGSWNVLCERFKEYNKNPSPSDMEKKLFAVDFSDNLSQKWVHQFIAFPTAAIAILMKQDESAFADIMITGTIMNSINRIFQPTFCGEQEGNREASKRLNKVTAEILKNER